MITVGGDEFTVGGVMFTVGGAEFTVGGDALTVGGPVGGGPKQGHGTPYMVLGTSLWGGIHIQ